jgi:hypothetical protein
MSAKLPFDMKIAHLVPTRYKELSWTLIVSCNNSSVILKCNLYQYEQDIFESSCMLQVVNATLLEEHNHGSCRRKIPLSNSCDSQAALIEPLIQDWVKTMVVPPSHLVRAYARLTYLHRKSHKNCHRKVSVSSMCNGLEGRTHNST